MTEIKFRQGARMNPILSYDVTGRPLVRLTFHFVSTRYVYICIKYSTKS